MKRLFDLLFALLFLCIGSPLFLLIAFLIRLTSQGKAIYSQTRIGRAGRPFQCYKFRTMYKNAEEELQILLEKDPASREEWQKTHKLKNDPRITKIGFFLRKTSLDELPQFWNVLKGELSVVGPRAVVAEEIALHFKEKAPRILEVRPGLTGLWQISGRSDITYEERIRLDEKYVSEHSFFGDLAIIIKTIPIIICARGAY